MLWPGVRGGGLRLPPPLTPAPRRRRRRLDYAESWISDHVLKPRTEELYRGLLANHLLPTFGNMDLSVIREIDVRRWRKGRLAAGLSRSGHSDRSQLPRRTGCCTRS